MQLAPHRIDRVANLCYRRGQRGFRNTKRLRPIFDFVLLFHTDLGAVLRTSLHSIVCHWRTPCSFTDITRITRVCFGETGMPDRRLRVPPELSSGGQYLTSRYP